MLHPTLLNPFNIIMGYTMLVFDDIGDFSYICSSPIYRSPVGLCLLLSDVKARHGTENVFRLLELHVTFIMLNLHSLFKTVP